MIATFRTRFENDVEMYGAQAKVFRGKMYFAFENDVEMYGAQANCGRIVQIFLFENDVEMYGAQALSVQKISL